MFTVGCVFRSARDVIAGLMIVSWLATPAFGQPAQQAPTTSANRSIDSLLEDAAQQAERGAPPAQLTYQNRFITVFRATILRRLPEDRVNTARQALDRMIRDGIAGPVSTRSGSNYVIFSAGGRDLFALVPADVDELAGATLVQEAEQTAARLETAMAEARELRTPTRLLTSGLQALAVSVLFAAVFWGLIRLRRSFRARIGEIAERQITASVKVDRELVRSSQIVDLLRALVTIVVVGIGLILTYQWLTFVLRRFPYSRPWGDSLRGFLFDQLAFVGRGIVNAAPQLFTILLIVVITRFVARVINRLFKAIEEGRMSISWIYPETLNPTRKLVLAGVWLFALAIAYPFLPGSNSEAFKGISVLVGLMVTLGSSGLVNQVMSGFTLTYSRALRVGDFVRVNDIDGTVTQIGALSTKIKTPRGEEVTIPNAVIVSQTVTNYTRFTESEGVFVPTSISIGYDVPWRQVHAMLLEAAKRTPGIRSQPQPVVRQTQLGDFAVTYTLFVSLERPQQRFIVLGAVHANILDVFNEHGVQIMSPSYEADPAERKVVPRDRWFETPAVEDSTVQPPPVSSTHR
jgi:small-conductance mechanosensitive channel